MSRRNYPSKARINASESHTGRSYLVSAVDLQQKLAEQRTLLIDTRDPEDYGKGHLPGAVNLPPSSMELSVALTADTEIHHLLAPVEQITPLLCFLGVRQNSRIVLYDRGANYRASRVFWILDYFNHPDISILDGGLSAWQSIHGPLVTRTADPGRGDFVPDPDASKIADFNRVRSGRNGGGTVLVNTLPEATFKKEAIPGSINIPYTEIYQSQQLHRLRTPEELQNLLTLASVSPAQEVIFYCGIGYTASLLYLAARILGYSKARLYDGSLSEWKARGGALEPGSIETRDIDLSMELRL
jgi:thiosulfate/3-mercaptopyruvate sulfurtransferase